MNDIFRNFVVVGAGGIGHFLTPALAKLLAFTYPGSNLTIIDGDTIEDKNLARVYSRHVLGALKAEVLAETCYNSVPAENLTITANSNYLSPDKLDRYHRSWLQDGTVIFACVDNNVTRVYLEELASGLDNVIYIAGGNAFTDGQAYMYVRLDGVDITPKMTEFSPDLTDMSDPTNHFPDDPDCTQEYESRPQLILANMTAAVVMLNLFYSQCVDITPSATSLNEVVFDITKGGATFVQRRQSLVRKTINV